MGDAIQFWMAKAIAEIAIYAAFVVAVLVFWFVLDWLRTR